MFHISNIIKSILVAMILCVICKTRYREGSVSHSIMDSNAYQQISQSNNDVCIEMDLLRVGSEPVGMRCPFCNEDVMTEAVYKNTTVTHLVSIFFGILFWWLCCCLLPYFVRKWKNVEHYCPKCQRFLGVYTRRIFF